jgi:hypothetical protein
MKTMAQKGKRGCFANAEDDDDEMMVGLKLVIF